MHLDGEEVDRKGLELQPDGDRQATLTTVVAASGEFVTGTVTVDDDMLTVDNRRHFVLQRRANIDVLIVNGGADHIGAEFFELYTHLYRNLASLRTSLGRSRRTSDFKLAAYLGHACASVAICDLNLETMLSIGLFPGYPERYSHGHLVGGGPAVDSKLVPPATEEIQLAQCASLP